MQPGFFTIFTIIFTKFDISLLSYVLKYKYVAVQFIGENVNVLI
jgi:hypothetical protein